MTPAERAEFIMQIEGITFDTGAKNDSVEIHRLIAAQIEEAEREAVAEAMKNWKPDTDFTPLLDLARQQGWNAAKEKAKGIALSCSKAKVCCVDIAEAISKMTPDSNETPQSGGGRMTP